jgi:hypothetical protein
VPVVSTATCAISGSVVPAAAIARLAATIAAFIWSRSCEVSTSTASAPPAIRPATSC